MASDSREAQILGAAKSVMYYNRIGSKEEAAANIEAVSAAEIMDTAQLLLSAGASVLTMR